MTRTLGTCSLCGGAVTVPTAWLGVHPPTPTCSSCGATAAAHGPVIPMRREPSETDRRHRACLPTPEEIRARNPHADLRWARHFGIVNEETPS